MDYLETLRNDAKLAEEFDMLFDFCLLDGLEERDTAEGRCTFSLPGKAFARDGAGGEYHQLEDGSIGYMSSEGECGRIAESIDDLIHLLVYSICWHDYCDASQYTDISTLEAYANERHDEIASYTEMDVWETVVQALGMPLEVNVAAELQKFYDAAHRAPLYICYFHEDDGTVTESQNLFFQTYCLKGELYGY